jgi:hypothetical protein
VTHTSNRPECIAEIARLAKEGAQPFDAAVREFIDAWQFMPPSAHASAIRQEPCRLDAIRDAYLAALAEHLALSDRIDVPEWTEHPTRFLREPFFAGGLESLKAILLVESPLAFRRRLIFISADGLSRPHHPMRSELFGAHPGSVSVREGTDLIAPALDVEPDAQSGAEIDR